MKTRALFRKENTFISGQGHVVCQHGEVKVKKLATVVLNVVILKIQNEYKSRSELYFNLSKTEEICPVKNDMDIICCS